MLGTFRQKSVLRGFSQNGCRKKDGASSAVQYFNRFGWGRVWPALGQWKKKRGLGKGCGLSPEAKKKKTKKKKVRGSKKVGGGRAGRA